MLNVIMSFIIQDDLKMLQKYYKNPEQFTIHLHNKSSNPLTLDNIKYTPTHQHYNDILDQIKNDPRH